MRRTAEIEHAGFSLEQSQPALLALPLCGCIVGPDYRRPDIDVPVAWRLGANEAGEISNIAWWDQFSPLLWVLRDVIGLTGLHPLQATGNVGRLGRIPGDEIRPNFIEMRLRLLQSAVCFRR